MSTSTFPVYKPASFSWADVTDDDDPNEQNEETEKTIQTVETELSKSTQSIKSNKPSPYGSAKPVNVKVSKDFVSTDFDPRAKYTPDCRNFRKTGTCPRGSLCRFRHDPDRIKAFVKSSEPVKIDEEGFKEVQPKRVLNDAFVATHKIDKKKTKEPVKVPEKAKTTLSVNVFDVLNESD